MSYQTPPLFAFDETDHLTRIHLKLALEDTGFAVVECGETVAIVPAPTPSPTQSPAPTNAPRT